MASRIIQLRWADECAQCHTWLPASTRAWWDAELRSTTCLDCEAGQSDRDPAALESDVPASGRSSDVVAPDAGRAGASAQREYERRHQHREARLDQRWGRLAGVAKFLSSDPQSITAWATGSAGERQLAEALAKRVGDRSVLLHDRKVPRTRGNIDHLAVSASGIWVIDAKRYQGLVERRDKGGLFSVDYRLYVGGRDKTKLADRLTWQMEAVRNALDGEDVPVHAALCFIDAEWRLFAKPFQLKGVWITWGKQLATMISMPGPLSDADVIQVGNQLAARLPAVL